MALHVPEIEERKQTRARHKEVERFHTLWEQVYLTEHKIIGLESHKEGLYIQLRKLHDIIHVPDVELERNLLVITGWEDTKTKVIVNYAKDMIELFCLHCFIDTIKEMLDASHIAYQIIKGTDSFGYMNRDCLQIGLCDRIALVGATHLYAQRQ